VLLRSLKFRSTASANFHVAQVLQRQGRKDEARNYLRTALELQPISSLQAKINALMAELN
jgi:Flp pilus assembly protein TadD